MMLNTKRKLFDRLNLVFFFQIKETKEVENGIEEIIDSITVQNWDEFKDEFCKQRFDTYKLKGYTSKEIINSELRKIELLKQMVLNTQAEDEYNILISRYENYIKQLRNDLVDSVDTSAATNQATSAATNQRKLNKINYLTSPVIIGKIHEYCTKKNYFLNGFDYNKFLECFDLNNKPLEYPKFAQGLQIKFVYILNELEKHVSPIKNFGKIVENQFGIKWYYNQKGKHELVFKNDVEKLFSFK